MLHYQHFTNKQKYLRKMLRCEEGRYGENIHGRKQEQKTSISVLTQFFATIAKNKFLEERLGTICDFTQF